MLKKIAFFVFSASLAVLGVGLAQAQTPAADPQSILQALNNIRGSGCRSNPNAAAAFRLDTRLSSAAARVASGAELAEALKATAYRSQRTTLIALSGYADAQAIAQGAASYSCPMVMDSDFKDVGFYAKDKQVWLVLAVPFSPPLAADAEPIETRVLALVNKARRQARLCGKAAMTAAQPLRLNASLRSTAAAHAEDMARYSYFSHTGRDGLHVPERANRAGYAWQAIGENIASGQINAELAVQGWLKSPSHCANLMTPGYTEMGLAFAVNPQSDAGVYWVQVFGWPQ